MKWKSWWISLNSFRKRAFLCLRAISLWLMLATHLHGQPGEQRRGVEQYRRTQWRAEEGLAAGHIQSLAQTPDGYLWIATSSNLLRFDGTRFTPLLTSQKEPLKRILSLTVDRSGTLWLRTQDARLMRVVNGTPSSVTVPNRQDLGIVAMAPGQTSGLFATNVNKNSIHFALGGVATVPVHSKSLLISIAQATDGKVWVGTRDQGLLVWDGEGDSSPHRARRRSQDQLPAAGERWTNVDRHG